MKAASGELNLTVITLIAISAVIAFFWLMWPKIKSTIGEQWSDINGGGTDRTGTQGAEWTETNNETFIVVDDYIIDYSK